MESSDLNQHVVMGLLFYPRGGSAQVVRYLATALARRGVPVSLISGSLGSPGDASHAPSFFGDLTVTAVDYTPASQAAQDGADPIAAPVPLHPSYEDRPGAPDRIITAVSPHLFEHLVAAWQQIFRRAVAHPDPIFHLHHLTFQQAAVARTWPTRPIISHLHGTELAMLKRIAERTSIAQALGTTLADMPLFMQSQTAGLQSRVLSARQQQILTTTRWEQWRYGAFWTAHLRAVAQQSHQLIAPSSFVREQAIHELGIDEARVTVVPNGVDTGRFQPRTLSAATTLTHLRRWVVDDPQGWDESGVPGSVRYTPDDLSGFIDPLDGTLYPILIFVGRFVASKRVPLLIRAYRRAQAAFRVPAPLLIWGGYPGEWEGEHPVTVARNEGEDGVFFIGWRGHEELALGLNVAAVLVAPSVDEAFGLVYLEAMASGVTVIATQSGGPPGMINTDPEQPSGWLVPPDDEHALVDALVEAVNHPDERAHRAATAHQHVHDTFSWDHIASQVEHLYQDVGTSESL